MNGVIKMAGEGEKKPYVRPKIEEWHSLSSIMNEMGMNGVGGM
jgi:hypothetical protein